MMTYRFGLDSSLLKRVTDVVLSLCTLPIAIPLIVMCCVAVFVVDGRPIFFVQSRAGKNGKPFGIIKLRTMTQCESDSAVDTLRITRLGRILRDWSLDELPGLICVLKGDMSLVGPRPLPVSYVEFYGHLEAQRLSVKPGLTGLAQVRGRNLLSWRNKFRYDRWYVAHRSAKLDFWIMIATVRVVLSRSGIYSKSGAIPERFKGSNAS